jgi:hypothetical protein
MTLEGEMPAKILITCSFAKTPASISFGEAELEKSSVNLTFPLKEIGYLNESSFKKEGLNSGNLA